MRFSQGLLALLAVGVAAGCGRSTKKSAAVPPPPTALIDTPYGGGTASTLAQDGRFIVQVQWQNRLKAKHIATAKLLFTDASRHQALAVTAVQMTPQLATTGQSSGLMTSLQITAQTEQPGVFMARMVLFPRRGRWDLRITAATGGKSDTAHVSVWVR